MATKGRNFNEDWNLMRDHYNNTNYDAQYPDDDVNDGVHLDHSRLYITNLPKDLNDDGLYAVFSKYGTLTEAFVSKDPHKRYGLVAFETAGEAKQAMMKLNRSAPLNLNINIAHKKKNQDNKSKDKERDRNRGSSQWDTNNYRDDKTSTGSRANNSRKQENLSNGENEMDQVDDDLSYMDSLDPNLTLEIEQLKLKQLKLQQAQVECQQRMLLLKLAEKKTMLPNPNSNRSILPDGRIVVHNNDRNIEPSRDTSAAANTGVAGDSIPALSFGSRSCVVCGLDTHSFCSRCRVTPYCSTRCQGRDWEERHKAVCHNLARITGKGDVKEFEDNEPQATPAPALRRPRSPDQQTAGRERNYENSTEKQNKKFVPPRNNVPSNNAKDSNANGSSKPGFRPNRGSAPARGGNRGDSRRPPLRTDARQPREEGEDWGSGSNSNSISQQSKIASPKKTTNSWESSKQNPTVTQPTITRNDFESSKREIPEKIPEEAAGPSGVPSKGPGSLASATPGRKLVPKNFVIETLEVGDTVLLSVDGKASECKTDKPGFVCLSLHQRYQSDYQAICEDYVRDCEADTEEYKPSPGDAFSLFNREDGAWYRSRCLSRTLAALLDSSKVVQLTNTDRCKRLHDKYEKIPEFCCLLNAEGIKIGDSLKCTLVSKTSDGFKVSLENEEVGESIKNGEITRWLPIVEYTTDKTTAAQSIPEVARPDIINNSKVVLVEVSEANRAFIRPADIATQRKYDGVLQDVLLYGQSATPLKEPPVKGQIVVGKFTDGLHYRALCKRTNVKQNKYLLEYIEFGNMDITSLEKLYPCPPELDLAVQPTVVSQIAFKVKDNITLTPQATDYLDKLKDSSAELLLTIPNGAKTAPSGTEVCLTVVKNNESLNKKIDEMCMPEWKKLEEKGVDVLETEVLMYSDLQYLELPARGCDIEILDVSALEAGSVSGYERGLKHAEYVFTTLTDKMEEYCNSEIGREPYFPKFEELCIAQCPPYSQWFRAVLCEQENGAGGQVVRVCYVDYGNVESVPVSVLRKMLPEFVKGLPAVSLHLEIRDFPKDPTPEMLIRAVEFLNVNEKGRGALHVERCEKVEPGYYVVDAPKLIAAMKGN